MPWIEGWPHALPTPHPSRVELPRRRIRGTGRRMGAIRCNIFVRPKTVRRPPRGRAFARTQCRNLPDAEPANGRERDVSGLGTELGADRPMVRNAALSFGAG